jgi:hypothetical protein
MALTCKDCIQNNYCKHSMNPLDYKLDNSPSCLVMKKPSIVQQNVTPFISAWNEASHPRCQGDGGSRLNGVR